MTRLKVLPINQKITLSGKILLFTWHLAPIIICHLAQPGTSASAVPRAPVVAKDGENDPGEEEPGEDDAKEDDVREDNGGEDDPGEDDAREDDGASSRTTGVLVNPQWSPSETGIHTQDTAI